MKLVTDAVTDGVRDWLGLILMGLGISAPFHDVVGGLLIAMGFASLIARMRRDGRKLWVVVSTAALCALLAMWVSEALEWTLKLQLVMAVAGALSGWAMNILVGLMDWSEDAAPDTADSVLKKWLQGGEK